MQKEEERKDWDQKMIKVQLLPPALASAVPIFFPLLRQFLFFYSPSVDAQRFGRVCQLVLTSTKNKGVRLCSHNTGTHVTEAWCVFLPEPANYFSPATKEKTRLGWLVQTKRLAHVCAQRLVVEYRPPSFVFEVKKVIDGLHCRPTDVQTPSASLLLMLVLCNASDWPLAIGDDKSVLASHILCDSISRGLFGFIRQALATVVLTTSTSQFSPPTFKILTLFSTAVVYRLRIVPSNRRKPRTATPCYCLSSVLHSFHFRISLSSHLYLLRHHEASPVTFCPSRGSCGAFHLRWSRLS